MTDLEMTKWCAEAMGVFGMITPSGEHIWMKGTVKRYDPLHDDAQAMELVKKFNLDIARMGDSWVVVKVKGNYDGVYGETASKDLNRAIVECVAKMQEEKNGTA